MDYICSKISKKVKHLKGIIIVKLDIVRTAHNDFYSLFDEN